MPATTASKLRIREGFRLRTFNAPPNFEIALGPLPGQVTIADNTEPYDQVHWFVRERTAMEKELPAILKLLKDNVVCWIYYPKRSSGVQTDLTRDKGWESLLKQDLQWLSLVSFDDTWSVFGMRRKTKEDEKRAAQAKPRIIFDYIDPVKKEVRLPEDLQAALQSQPAAKSLFDSLAFTHRKEYLEWIVTAKKEETRRNRISKAIDMMTQGKKHPSDR